MPTLHTVTVKSAGGDYTSLSAAEAGEQGDLVSLDRQLDIECYAMDDVLPGAALGINGWTTDATRYIRAVVPAAERHSGAWNTSKYRLRQTGPDLGVIAINEDYVRLEGLQLEGNERDVISITSTAVAASSDIRIDSCITKGGGTDTGVRGGINAGSGATTVRNTIIYGFGPANSSADGVICTFTSNAATVNCDNVTVANVGGEAFNRAAGTLTLRNCYAHGNTDAYNGTMTRTTCAHSSATVFAGSTASIAHDTTNFTNVTAGSEDYHLVSGASATLKTGGTDLSGTFTTDIDGETRSDWSIGADEIVAAGGDPEGSLIGGKLIRGGLLLHGVLGR